MNENGQFLLYDALISILILFIVIISMFYILNQEEDFIQDNTEVLDRLNLLASYSFNDKNILLKLEENDSAAQEVVQEILSDKSYTLRDLTINRTILNRHSNNYKNSITAKKVIENHEFELTFFS